MRSTASSTRSIGIDPSSKLSFHTTS
jgi:hypothetical protein